jgi:hypothetical protein
MSAVYTLWETKTRLFLTSSSQTGHRILKIDRGGEPPTPDPATYTRVELDDLLSMIAEGSRSQGGLSVLLEGFYGVAGLVQFLEGPYLVCITGRQAVAVLGGKTVYQVSDVRLVPVGLKGLIPRHPDEARYVQIFNGVDMRRNFYFSSYDLANTLQGNLEGNPGDDKFVWNASMLSKFGADEWSTRLVHGYLEQRSAFLCFLEREGGQPDGLLSSYRNRRVWSPHLFDYHCSPLPALCGHPFSQARCQ